MAFLQINNVRISGVSAAVPTRIKEIREQKCFTDPIEADKVISVTHVERSRMVAEGQCCSDLCFAAADKLLNELHWNRDEVDALIYVSLSRDYVTPATAGLLQDRLGLGKECFAVDIPLACSGYIYGMSTISSLVATGGIKKALLLVGETTSFLQSPLDKTLWPLHGDAGTATALEYDEKANPLYFHLGTDGSRGNAIINRDGGTRFPFSKDSLEMHEIELGVIRNNLQSQMEGMDVFSFSTKEPPMSIRALCEHFDLDLSAIRYLYLHQANKYMDDKIAKKLKVDEAKVPYSIMQFGNTSSASIPMTMVAATRESIQHEKMDVVMCGFGSGLSWGSLYATLDHIVCPDIIEIEA